MPKNRLEAFSDGVLAIIITIMVLELKAPHQADLAGMRPLLGSLCAYVLSFVYVGIYWNNHHQMLHATQRVSGAVLWANLHLLFWLSLFPFVTDWMGETHLAPIPTASYGFVLMMAALAYWILQTVIVRGEGRDSVLAKAIGRDLKGKLSPVCYATAIGLSFVSTGVAAAIYVGVALMWLIPDQRITRTLDKQHP